MENMVYMYPAVRKNSTGVSWANENEGEFIDLEPFL